MEGNHIHFKKENHSKRKVKIGSDLSLEGTNGGHDKWLEIFEISVSTCKKIGRTVIKGVINQFLTGFQTN